MVAILLICYVAMMLFVGILGIVGIYFLISSRFMRHPPSVPSSGIVKQALLEDIEHHLNTVKSQKIMDLGCGWGTLLIPLAKKYPNHIFVGIEFAFTTYWVCRWRTRKLKNVTILRENLLHSDISSADIVILFLFQKIMLTLKKKCLSEMKKSALIYTNRFYFPAWKPDKKVCFKDNMETYYVYRIASKVKKQSFVKKKL